MYMFMYFMISIFICMLLFNLNLFISLIKYKNFEKKLPFECGFMPISKSNLPFSMPFYMMALMFLIFDIEIILLIPIITYLPYMNMNYMYMSTLIMLIFLLSTLMYEMLNGYLKWIY